MSSRPSKRRRGLVRWAVRAAVLVVVFAVGIAFGQAVDDSSPPAGTQTSVRTLAPVTLSADTVTVTVTTTR